MKLITKIVGATLGLAMAIGVGVGVSANNRVAKKAYAASTSETNYSLISNTADLEAGKSYILTSGISGTVKAAAVDSNSNNRKTTDATVSNGKITRGSSILSFTLGGSSGAWTFLTENYGGTDGYLASAASGNKNYLRVLATNTEEAHSATISFSGSAAVINIEPHTSRTLVRYNSSNDLFACYESGQSAVYLFKEVEAGSSDVIQANSVTIKSGVNTISGTYEPSLPYHVGGTLDLSSSVVNYQDGEGYTPGLGAIEWSSSATNVATVSNGIVTFVNSGTATITATAADKGAGDTTISASFTLNLNNAMGSVAHPYTIAQAVAAIDAANAQINGVYVTGIVSQVDSYDAEHHSITYWISDDGTTTDQFEVYGGKGIGGADFDFILDVETGATVVIHGNIKKYYSTYEFAVNSQLVTYSPLTKYTVSFDSNGGSSVPSQRVVEGEKAQRPSNPSKDPDEDYEYTFVDWYDSSTDSPYDFDSEVTSDVALYAVWNQTPRSAVAVLKDQDTSSSLAYHYRKNEYVVTDTLNNAFTGGISGTTYKDWSGKTDESDAVYTGNSAGDNGSIQLRSSNSSGIITTTSGGKAKNVTVSWENHTANGRTLDIYGKNTAYSATSDLYNNSNQGTKLGSIVYGTSTTLAITGDYAYIGIRSNNGAQYVDSIEIDWEFADSDFTYSNVVIKFGGEVSTTLWSRLESRNILGYGVMLTEPSYLTSVSASSIESLYETKEASAGSVDAARELRDGIYYIKSTNVKYFYSEVSPSAPAVSGGNRVWNLAKSVNGTLAGLTRNYTAVAFIRTADDGLVFLKQTTKCAAQIADDLYDVDLDESVEGSLGNLALMLG